VVSRRITFVRPTGASVCIQTRAQAVVDSGTSSSSLEQLRVPRGEGLQSLAMSETLPPHLCGLQQTAVPTLALRGVVIEHE